MKKGWTITKLSSLTSKIGSGATPRGGQKSYKEEGISLIRSLNVYDAGFTKNKLAFIDEEQAAKLENVEIQKADVLINITGASVARCCVVDTSVLPARVNQHVSILRTKKELISPSYLHYYLTSPESKTALLEIGEQGATRQAITKTQLQNFSIPFPPLAEQEAIVEVLDKAFTAIDQAKANLEQNIANAKELFQSKLNQIFSQKGDGWEEKEFQDVCVLQRGYDLPKRLRIQGQYPLVTSSGVNDTHAESKVLGPGVATGRSGSIGNVFYVKKDFWPLNTALYIKEFHGNNEKFIYYFLRSFDLSRFSSGAGVPTLNRNFVHSEKVWITHDKSKQLFAVQQLDELENTVGGICQVYQTKLTSLDELKKSILQKAFAGELT